jgi:hypothetical protein
MEKKDKTNKKGQENWSHKNDFPIEEVWHTYKALAELIAPRLRTFKCKPQVIAQERNAMPA